MAQDVVSDQQMEVVTSNAWLFSYMWSEWYIDYRAVEISEDST